MPPRSEDAVEQVRSRLNLADIVRQHVRLRRQGREWVGLCPFHEEKTPSFSVNEQKQSWYCFGCQRGGDLFDFVATIERTDFAGALRILAEQAGVELPERSPADRRQSELRRRILELNRLAAHYYEYVLHNLSAGEPGRALLSRRRVGEEIARRFGLGFAPGGASLASYLGKKGLPAADARAAGLVRADGRDFFQQRLVVPIRDERGQPLAFTGRTVLPDEVRKYVNTKQTPAYQKGRVVFALDLARGAIDERGHAVLMEGQFDVITAHQFGVTNAVATSGTALTEEQARLLRRHTEELVLAFDNDGAGQLATERAVELAAGVGLRTRVARLEEGVKDPDEFFRSGGKWEEVLEQARPGWEHLIRTALEGLSPRRPSDVELAVKRISALLERIPDPAVRESYRESAGVWFGIDPRLIAARPPAAAGRRPLPSGPGSPAVAPGGQARPSQAGERLSRLVAYLLQVLAVRPEEAGRVRAVLSPEVLADQDREAYLRLLATLERGGAEALVREVGQFPAEEARLIREAWAAPPAKFAGEDVGRLVERILARARRERISTIIGRLSEAEARGDRAEIEALTREYRDLQAQQVMSGKG